MFGSDEERSLAACVALVRMALLSEGPQAPRIVSNPAILFFLHRVPWCFVVVVVFLFVLFFSADKQ